MRWCSIQARRSVGVMGSGIIGVLSRFNDYEFVRKFFCVCWGISRLLLTFSEGGGKNKTMTRHYQPPASIPLKQTVNGVLFSARFVRVMARLVLRRVFRDACMWHARKIFQRKDGSKPVELGMAPDGKGEAALVGKQEWYSLSELAVIYGVSRRTLGRILKEAENQGHPVRFCDMTNPNGGKCSRKRLCLRFDRKGLDEYLEIRSREGRKK